MASKITFPFDTTRPSKISRPQVTRMVYERRKRGLSQTSLGGLLKTIGGLHRFLRQTEVSSIERGRVIPTEHELAAFAKVYGIEPPMALFEVVTIDPDDPRQDPARDPARHEPQPADEAEVEAK